MSGWRLVTVLPANIEENVRVFVVYYSRTVREE